MMLWKMGSEFIVILTSFIPKKKTIYKVWNDKLNKNAEKKLFMKIKLSFQVGFKRSNFMRSKLLFC